MELHGVEVDRDILNTDEDAEQSDDNVNCAAWKQGDHSRIIALAKSSPTPILYGHVTLDAGGPEDERACRKPS